MNRKSIYFKILTALVCTTFLYSCSSKTATQNQTQDSAKTVASIIGDKNIAAVIGELVTYDKEDSYTDWQSGNPNYIELTGTSASLKGSGAEIKDSKITINSAGVYVLSGKLANGQIVVDVQDKSTVRLVLNGVEITSSDSAPIYVKNAGKAVVSLQEGTENIITDGEKYALADASTDEPSAAIFSKADLAINGTGKLTVKANYKDGITSKDDLKITGGTLMIYSKDDGVIGKDMIAVKTGSLYIEAGGDGIKSTNEEDSKKGFIALEAGSYDLKTGSDGIQAESYVLIADGSFNITSGGGNTKGVVKVGDNGPGAFGGPGDFGTQGMPQGGNPNAAGGSSNPHANPPSAGSSDKNAVGSTAKADESSHKGLKAAGEIGIGGGIFKIDSADDAVHSNNSVVIAGGDLSITSGDDGIHADTSITAKAGKINITKSYEGIESSLITIKDGEIHVAATDDGINVSGGNDGSSVNGRPGQNNFASNGNNKLIINGGYLAVNSNGDSLDSNGSIAITGGKIVVSGPTANNNGALDYDGTFEMTGGFLISAGSSGMAQAPSEQSTQFSIAMTYPQVQAAGTLVHLQDTNGTDIVTFAPEKSYQTVVICSPELKKGSSYSLYSGGKSTGNAVDGLYSGGKYESGTKIVDFTLANSVTWLNESGVTTARSSMPGRQGGQGGKTNPGDPNNPRTPKNQGTGGIQNPPVKANP